MARDLCNKLRFGSALNISRHQLKRAPYLRIESVKIEKVREVEVNVASVFIPAFMSLEHLSECGDMQVCVPARQRLYGGLLVTAFEGDALHLKKFNLLLRCQHGLEVPRLVHALIYAPCDICLVCILHMTILPFVVSLSHHAPPLSLCWMSVSLVWSLPSSPEDAVVRTGSSHGPVDSSYPRAQVAHPPQLRKNARNNRVPWAARLVHAFGRQPVWPTAGIGDLYPALKDAQGRVVAAHLIIPVATAFTSPSRYA